MQVVETAKRILMKEKIERQLAGQTSLTPFMNIRDNCRKRLTFNMTDDIEQKIDKLTLLMGKLVTNDKGQNKPLSHLNHICISQIRVEVKIEVTIKAGLDLITRIEAAQDIIKILGVE